MDQHSEKFDREIDNRKPKVMRKLKNAIEAFNNRWDTKKNESGSWKIKQ